MAEYTGYMFAFQRQMNRQLSLNAHCTSSYSPLRRVTDFKLAISPDWSGHASGDMLPV